MTDEKFNQAIDEIVGFIVDVQKLQMDQLKQNIKTAYGATIHETDPHAIAEMIMNMPVKTVQSKKVSLGCVGRVSCGDSFKMIDKDPVVKAGGRGNLEDLSYVQNVHESSYGKDFYHHCPDMQDDLVRLTHSMSKGGRRCPVCYLEFEPK